MLRAFKATPLPILLLVLSFLCPTELSLDVGGLRLPPHRIALLLLFPLAALRILLKPGIRIRSFDVLMVVYGVWTLTVFCLHAGMDGFVYGGSVALESLGGYLVARAFIRDAEAFRATLKVMAAAIILAALIALPETFLGKIYLHNTLAEITGNYYPVNVETRKGLTRAYSVFDHPIHYGTFCAAFLALFWYMERSTLSSAKKAMLVAGATVLGMSSAPLLCVGLQTGMLIWERVTRGIQFRTSMTVAVVMGLYIGASLVSERGPFALIATGMTFDPWTGFYRLQIWTHGLENVWSSPWTGIGFNDWMRPAWMAASTVDAFWLVIAMRTGIPAFLLLVLAILAIGRAVVRHGTRSRDPKISNLAMGWMMSLIAMSLIACTVHYWNVLNAFFFFFIGLAGWIADPRRLPVAQLTRQAAPAGAPHHGRPRRPAYARPRSRRPAARPYGMPPESVPA